MKIRIRERPPLERGDFWRFPDGSVLHRCIDCGETAELDHEIAGPDDAPTVTPSLVCPRESCGAHYFIRAGFVERVGGGQ